jgi:hypothetical protein
MRNKEVEIKLTRYQSVPITLEERKRDLEESIRFYEEERQTMVRRYFKKLEKFDLDLNNKKAELKLVKEALK